MFLVVVRQFRLKSLLLIMNTPADRIENLLSDLESFGWTGGKRADVMQRIVKIASKEFIEEMAEMGNGKAESVSILANSIQDVNS